PQLELLPVQKANVLDPLDTDRRKHLNDGLEALNRSLLISKQIVSKMNETPLPRELQDLSQNFERARRAMLDAIRAYEKVDPVNQQKSDDDILRLPEVANAYAGDLGTFFKSKIDELNQRSAARLRAAGYQLKMGAFRIRRGADAMPVHLPSYDTY